MSTSPNLRPIEANADTIFFNALQGLQVKYEGRLFVQYVFSQSAIENPSSTDNKGKM